MNTTVAEPTNSKFYELSATSIDGSEVKLSDYSGKVILIVNTASRCGFTPQYEGLQALYEKYQSQGLEILGFPSNDFMEQEPGSNQEIKKFCTLKYGVKFPMFQRNPVSGDAIQPVFKYLTEQANPDLTGKVRWNFEKFIIDRKGNLRERYRSFTGPSSKKLIKLVEKLLLEAN